MKFKQYLAFIAAPDGFIPTPHLRWEIRQNPRATAREEAIVGKILEEANPRENITGRFPWGPEQQMVLQQLWIHPAGSRGITHVEGKEVTEWRDITIKGAQELYTDVPTEHGEDLPIPNAIKEPGVIQGDFGQRIKEILGD